MYKHLPSPVKYREDINGLRAWAVIAVLLFHFSLIGLPGGFVGVDVFFVISGYLMTAIIIGAYEKRNFSILKFYMSRLRRILPALLVVITALLAIGWFYLPTPDYQDLGKQSIYSLVFLSNIGYGLSAGYFDSVAKEKWLLHTWSLAVEAQFYFLYPIFIALIWKFWQSIKGLTIGILLLFSISLCLNLIASFWKPTAAFYLLPTRGWELVAGGLVYITIRQVSISTLTKSIGFWMGWALVFGSFLLIDEGNLWPGYWAIIPVFGTSLIILGQNENYLLTNNALAQWIGNRSYSLYLWHWPFVVALNFWGELYNWAWVSVAIALSFLFAHLSYKFIEVPTRLYLSTKSLRKETIVLAALSLGITVFAYKINNSILDERIHHSIDKVAMEAHNHNPTTKQCHTLANEQGTPSCRFGDGDLKAIVWGDSHANALISASTSALHGNGSVLEWSFPGCPSILGAQSTPWRFRSDSFNCLDSSSWMEDKLITKNEYPNTPLLILTRTSYYLFGKLQNEDRENDDQLKPIVYFNKPIEDSDDLHFKQEFKDNIINTACRFQKKRQVYLMRPIPEMGLNVPKTLSRNLIFDREANDIKITLNDYHRRNKFIWKAQDEAASKCGIKILNPLPYLCDKQHCFGSINNIPLYYDDDHLSEYGNKFLVPMFESVFK